MKVIISSQQVKSIIQLNQVGYFKKKAYTADTTSALKSDTFVMSSRAQDLQFAKEQVLKSPDVNADKINRLKKQLQEGQYQVSGQDVAQKMLSRSLVDELVRR